ncbi:MAG: 1-deoxy-D-xylulose-5-phosphate synthase, partial [Lachnospiraceae bacterium]|nr:1-deoxy-D-xylulose-5-phosphate synthase [Lachnospiraceae bacterium]
YQDFKVNLQNMLQKTRRGKEVVDSLKRYKNSVKQLFVPGMLFEDMGLTYLGPVDGHDIKTMCRLINVAKKINHAVLIHVRTVKGRGYAPAECHPARFHGTEPFDIETGLPKANKKKAGWTDIFSTVMIKLASSNEKVCAITAAMPDGTGLNRFKNLYPDRFFDVGIAEEHAVTFAAGLAAGGMTPVVAVYSSFLQRAYDQVLHDVCIQNLHVVFAIDRAGLVGADGETHQGVFDLSYLSSIPNMHIMAPKNKWELSDMLKFAVGFDGPIAMRYGRGTACDKMHEFRAPIEMGKSETLYDEGGIWLFAVGSMVETALDVREKLKEKGYKVSLVNARFVKPIDEEAVAYAVKSAKVLVTMEENVLNGAYGEKVRHYADSINANVPIINIGIPDAYIEHGNVDILKKITGIDADSVVEKVISVIGQD